MPAIFTYFCYRGAKNGAGWAHFVSRSRNVLNEVCGLCSRRGIGPCRFTFYLFLCRIYAFRHERAYNVNSCGWTEKYNGYFAAVRVSGVGEGTKNGRYY